MVDSCISDYRGQHQARLTPHVLEAAPPHPSPLACLPPTYHLICLSAYTSGLKQILILICFPSCGHENPAAHCLLSWMSAVVPVLFPGRWSGAHVVEPHRGRSFSNSLRRDASSVFSVLALALTHVELLAFSFLICSQMPM